MSRTGDQIRELLKAQAAEAASPPATAAKAPPAAKPKTLDEKFNEQEAEVLAANPEYAAYRRQKELDEKLKDFSLPDSAPLDPAKPSALSAARSVVATLPADKGSVNAAGKQAVAAVASPAAYIAGSAARAALNDAVKYPPLQEKLRAEELAARKEAADLAAARKKLQGPSLVPTPVKRANTRDIPDIGAVRALAQKAMTGAASTGDRQKATQTFLKERQAMLLKAWDYEGAVPQGPDREKVVADKALWPAKAYERAKLDLANMYDEGVWGWPVMEQDTIPAGAVGDVLRGMNAFLPQRTVTPQGSVRSEGLGWWALGTLSTPEYLLAAGLDPDTDWKQAIAERKDLPTLYLEKNPSVAEDLASGDNYRVHRAVAQLLPIMAVSVLVPDPLSLTAGGAQAVDVTRLAGKFRGPLLEATARTAKRTARANEVADLVSDAYRQTADAEGAARLLESSGQKEAAYLLRNDTAAHMGVLDEDVAKYLDATAQAQGDTLKAVPDKLEAPPPPTPTPTPRGASPRDAEGRQIFTEYVPPAEEKPPAKADAGWSRPNIDVRFDERRAVVNDRLDALLEERRQLLDQAAEARDAAGEMAERGEDKALVAVVDRRIALEREALRKIDNDEAVMRGFAKVEGVYQLAGQRAAEGIVRQARGLPSGTLEAPVRALRPQVTQSILDALDLPHARGLVRGAANGLDGLVRALGKLTDAGQDALAARILDKAPAAWRPPEGVRPYEHLRTVVRFDPVKAQAKVTKLRDAAAAAHTKAAALAQREAILAVGPANKEAIRQTSAAMRAAETAATKAAREEAALAVKAARTDLDAPPALLKARAEYQKRLGVANALREQAGRSALPADPVAVSGIRATQREKRFYTPEHRDFSRTGEPYTLEERQGVHVSRIPIQDQDKAWTLYKDRTAYGMERYSYYVPDLAKVDGTATANAQRGLPLWEGDHPTPGALWHGFEPTPAYRAWYDAVEQAVVPGLPRAPSWNVFWRSELPFSDLAPGTYSYVEKLDPEVIRIHDTVSVRDPELAKRVNATHAKHGADPEAEHFLARVVGFENTPDGARVKLQPVYRVGGGPRRKVDIAWNVETVSAKPDALRYYERGRSYPEERVSVPGPGKAKTFKSGDLGRMYTPEAWLEVFKQEKRDTSGLARSLRYGPDSTFSRMNPPRMGERTDFYLAHDEIEMVAAGEVSDRGMRPPPGSDAPAAARVPEAALRAADEGVAEALKKLKAAEADDVAAVDAARAAYDEARTARRQATAALDKARTEHLANAGLQTATDRQALRIPEVQANRVKAEQEARALTRAADELETLVDEHATLEQALGESLGAQVGELSRAADEFETVGAAARKDKADAVATPKVSKERTPAWRSQEEFLETLESIKRTNAAALKSTARIRIESLVASLRSLLTPAGEVMNASLTQKTVDTLDAFDGAIADLEKRLAKAFEGAKPGTREVNRLALDVIDENLVDIRGAYASGQLSPDYLTLATRAYISAGQQLVEANEKLLHAVLVDWLDEPRRAAEAAERGLPPVEVTGADALRERLLSQSEAIVKDAKQTPWQEPQYGDGMLAQSLGRIAAQSRAIDDLVGQGVAIGASDAAAANNWVAGQRARKGARGRQLVINALVDPLAYRSSWTTFLRTETKGLAETAQVPFVKLSTRSEKPAGVAATLAKMAFKKDVERVMAAAEAIDGTNLYVPRAVRDRLNVQIETAMATYVAPNVIGVSDVLTNYWKQSITTGLFYTSPRYYWTNKLGDFDQAAERAGFVPTLKMSYQSALSEVMATPGVANAARALDALRGVEGGTSISQLDRVLASVSVGGSGGAVGKIMDGLGEVRIGGTVYDARKLYQACLDHGVFETFVTGELTRTVAQLMQESTGFGKTLLGRILVANDRAVRDAANLIATRRRVGLFYALVEGGKTPKEAAQIVKEALYDFGHTLHPYERGVIQWVHPFWTFEKNNLNRTWRAFTRPQMWAGGSVRRIKQLHQVKSYSSQVVSWYLDSTDEYGYDRNSMMEDPDPTLAQALYDDLYKAGMDPADIDKEIRRRFEDGEIPSAWVAYEQALARTQGLGRDERVRALADDVGMRAHGIYYAPDPTRMALPPWAANRYVVWLGNKRTAELDSWNRAGVGRDEKAGDTQRFISIVDDASGAAMGRGMGLLALLYNMGAAVANGAVADGNPSAGDRVVRSVDTVMSSPYDNPTFEGLLSFFGQAPNDASPRKIPPGAGALLAAVGLAEREDVQAQGEDPSLSTKDKYKRQYKMSSETEARLWLLRPLAVALFGAVAVEDQARSMAGLDTPPGAAPTVGNQVASGAARFMGQKIQETSPTEEARRADRRAGDRIEAFNRAATAAQTRSAGMAGGAVAAQEMAAVRYARDLRDAGTYDAEAQAAPARAMQKWRQSGEVGVRPADILLLRYLLVESGTAPEAAYGMPTNVLMDLWAEKAGMQPAVSQ